MLRWLWLGVLVLVLDQATKYLAVSGLDLHVPVAVLPSLNLTLTYNAGAAFSLLGDAGGWQRWFFSAVSIGVSAGIVVWLHRLPREAGWLACSLALVLGGALGNLVDRIRIGAVVDFIDLYHASWHWPAFNVADSAISIGAVMLLVSAFRPAVAEGGR